MARGYCREAGPRQREPLWPSKTLASGTWLGLQSWRPSPSCCILMPGSSRTTCSSTAHPRRGLWTFQSSLVPLSLVRGQRRRSVTLLVVLSRGFVERRWRILLRLKEVWRWSVSSIGSPNEPWNQCSQNTLVLCPCPWLHLLFLSLPLLFFKCRVSPSNATSSRKQSLTTPGKYASLLWATFCPCC